MNGPSVWIDLNLLSLVWSHIANNGNQIRWALCLTPAPSPILSLSLSISLDLLDSSHTELQQLFRDKLLERTWTFCNGSSKSDKKHVQVCSFFWPLSVNLSGTASLVHEPPLRAHTHTHTLFLSSCPKKPYTFMHYATCLLTNFCHSAAKGVVESFGMLSPLPSHHSVNRFQSAINYAMEKKSAQ